MRPIRDSDGVEVKAGCIVRFAYGQPPVPVAARVVERNGKLIALTPGHNPKECPISELRKHVYDFWVAQSDAGEVTG